MALDPEDVTASSSKASFAPGMLVAGAYRLYEDLNWTAGVRGTTFFKQPLDDAVDDFDVGAVTPGLFARYRAWPFEIPTTTSASYTFRQDWVGGSPFSRSHSTSLAVRVRPRRWLALDASYSLAIKDFDDDGADPAVTSRDAVGHSFGVGASFVLPGDAVSVSFGYGFGLNDADGDDFDSESHGVSGRLQWRIVRDIYLNLHSGYSRVEYVNFTTTPQREQDNLSYGATLYVVLFPNTTVDLGVARSENDSNLSEFTTLRNVVTLGVTVRF